MSERKSLKRKSDWSTSDINENNKRFKDNNQQAHRINPNKGFNINNERNNFNKIDKEIPNNNTNNNNNNNTDNELDGLLYKLSRLDVGNDQSKDRCPICSELMNRDSFASHVYSCLDRIGEHGRNSIEKQIEEDENYALALTTGYKSSYQSDASVECPMCHKIFHVGEGINVHVNMCIDQSNNHNDDIIIDKNQNNNINIQSININNNNNINIKDKKASKKLNDKQMAAVATHILSEQKGSKEYDKMLEMFSCLGFKKDNMSKIVEQHKNNGSRNDNKSNWSNSNNYNNNNNNNNNNNEIRMTSPPFNKQKNKTNQSRFSYC